jgi:hypothetical protein
MATKKTAEKSPAKAPSKTAAKSTSAKSAAKSAAKKAPAKSSATETAQPAKTGRTPAHHEIAELAHKYYTERGHGHHGKHVDDWLRAEKELSK